MRFPFCSTRISKVGKCAAFQLWTPTYFTYILDKNWTFAPVCNPTVVRESDSVLSKLPLLPLAQISAVASDALRHFKTVVCVCLIVSKLKRNLKKSQISKGSKKSQNVCNLLNSGNLCPHCPPFLIFFGKISKIGICGLRDLGGLGYLVA